MKNHNSLIKLILVASLSLIVSLSGIAGTFQQSKTVLLTYSQIKDALVKTDSKAASAAAKDLVELTKGMSDELSKKIASNGVQISESSDVTVQRKLFVDLSEEVYSLVKNSSEHESPVYKQYCPMAKAYWLASEKEINNPYFGDKMLHCGSVTEEL